MRHQWRFLVRCLHFKTIENIEFQHRVKKSSKTMLRHKFTPRNYWYWFDSILTIRFNRHAIGTDIWKSWLKLNTHSHYSLLSRILSSNVWFYPSLMYMPAIIRSLLLSGGCLNGEINARKSAAPKMEIPMVTIGRSGLCLNMANSAVMFRLRKKIPRWNRFGLLLPWSV